MVRLFVFKCFVGSSVYMDHMGLDLRPSVPYTSWVTLMDYLKFWTYFFAYEMEGKEFLPHKDIGRKVIWLRSQTEYLGTRGLLRWLEAVIFHGRCWWVKLLDTLASFRWVKVHFQVNCFLWDSFECISSPWRCCWWEEEIGCSSVSWKPRHFHYLNEFWTMSLSSQWWELMCSITLVLLLMWYHFKAPVSVEGKAESLFFLTGVILPIVWK